MLVLDASVVVAWGFREEGSQLDDLIRRVAAEVGIVPMHWVLELTNTLLQGERRGRLKAGQQQEILSNIQALPIRIDEETCQRGWRETLALAETFGLTTYDAAYLELAMRLDVPLATLDQDLARAARAAKVRLLSKGTRPFTNMKGSVPFRGARPVRLRNSGFPAAPSAMARRGSARRIRPAASARS